MKTMVMAAILTVMCMGISHSLKAGTVSDSVILMSVSNVSTSTENTIQSSQQQLKKELTRSVHSLTKGVKQTANAVVDVVTSVVAYVFLSAGQALASIALD
jgi:hypothetical protein